MAWDFNYSYMVYIIGMIAYILDDSKIKVHSKKFPYARCYWQIFVDPNSLDKRFLSN